MLMPFVRGLLDLLAPRCCGGCEIELLSGEQGLCGGCVLLLEEHGDEDAAFVFEGPVSEAIRALKYRHRTDLAPYLATLMHKAASPLAGTLDAVVPVPLHRRRLAERGFNQSALLARPLGTALGVPALCRALERVRSTPPQVGLARPDRRSNVAGAFRARRPLEGMRVLLVDDVRTTGATLTEARLALREGGAAEVWPLALAGARSA